MNNSLKNKAPKFSIYWMYAIVLIILVGIFYLDDNTITKKLDNMNQFEKLVESGGVTKITVLKNKDQAEATLNDSLAKATFHESQLQKGRGGQAKVVVEYGDLGLSSASFL